MNQPTKDDIKLWIFVVLCIGTCGVALPFIFIGYLIYLAFQ